MPTKPNDPDWQISDSEPEGQGAEAEAEDSFEEDEKDERDPTKPDAQKFAQAAIRARDTPFWNNEAHDVSNPTPSTSSGITRPGSNWTTDPHRSTPFPLYKLGAMNDRARQLWLEGLTTEDAIERIFEETAKRSRAKEIEIHNDQLREQSGFF